MDAESPKQSISAFELLILSIGDANAREELFRMQAKMGLSENDPLYFLGLVLAKAVNVPTDLAMCEIRAIPETITTNAADVLEELRGAVQCGVDIRDGVRETHRKLLAVSGGVVAPLNELVDQLNTCARAVQEVGKINSEALKYWNEAQSSMQREKSAIVEAAVSAGSRAGSQQAGKITKAAVLTGLMVGIVSAPVGVLILKLFGGI